MDQMTAISLSKWKKKSDYQVQSSEVRKKRRNRLFFRKKTSFLESLKKDKMNDDFSGM